jgi:hypothetical protein
MTKERAIEILSGLEPPQVTELRHLGFGEYKAASRARREWDTAQEIARDGGAAMAKAAEERRGNGCGCDNAPDCLCR